MLEIKTIYFCNFVYNVPRASLLKILLENIFKVLSIIYVIRYYILLIMT